MRHSKVKVVNKIPRLAHGLVALILGLVATVVAAEPQRIVVPAIGKMSGDHMYFFPAVLDLALSKTAEDGPYEIVHYTLATNGARTLTKLRSGELDVVWTMSNPQREQEFLSVPISLLRGLSSHRVFLIRKEDQARFSQVGSLDDLKSFSAGLGESWPDTDVLRANGLGVITSPEYRLLFNMLANKRFEYVPRGLYEVWEEHRKHKDKGLIIEQSVMLRYTGPIYFYVNRRNGALAERLERGLELALEEGSFQALFDSVPGFRYGMQEMLKNSRKRFDLRTPAEIANGAAPAQGDL